MVGPFPGMDPYLEQHWGDVHTSLIVYMRDAINEQLPDDLQARVEEAVMVDTDQASRTVYPDVQVVEEPETPFDRLPAVSATVPVAEPHMIPLPQEPPTQRHIEIVDASNGNRMVTAIELLSPANKVGGLGRRAYRQKQQDYLQGGANLVEIDLIRAGQLVVAVPEHLLPHDCRTPYLICIRRANRLSNAEVIPVSLREPLPNIGIPLRPTDRDVILQLQPLLDACYRRGRYSSIDYTQPLSPQLPPDDRQWADRLLSEKHAK